MWYNIKSQNIGMSPSGKALDFDSSIRQFKSGHPSQKKARASVLFSTKSAVGGRNPPSVDEITS